MGRGKNTETQNVNNRINRDVAKYMSAVTDFIENATGGPVPLEYQCSLIMLESYYKQLLMLNAEISKLDSLMIKDQHGSRLNPILGARDTCVSKLDMLLKQLGLTFNSQIKLKVKDVTKTESNPLDDFITGKEYR